MASKAKCAGEGRERVRVVVNDVDVGFQRHAELRSLAREPAASACLACDLFRPLKMQLYPADATCAVRSGGLEGRLIVERRPNTRFALN